MPINLKTLLRNFFSRRYFKDAKSPVRRRTRGKKSIRPFGLFEEVGKEFFKVSYSFTRTAGNWVAVDATLPKWSSTDSTASSWTNSVSTNNNGTHIEISNIVIGGMGTVTATLTANVLIKKWGTEDVTMTLDVDPAFIDGA